MLPPKIKEHPYISITLMVLFLWRTLRFQGVTTANAKKNGKVALEFGNKMRFGEHDRKSL
jgi:hypothetical protein